MPRTKPLPASTPKQEEVVVNSKRRDASSWFGVGLLLLIVAAMIVQLFPDVIFKGRVFFYRDAGIFNYPTHYFERDSLRHGELPLWNPWNNCGIPFLAQWNVMALYPLTLIFVCCPVPTAITMFSLLHFLIGAAGMYCLAKRWTGNRFAACVAGLAFAWNGLTIHALMWPNSCASLAWVGWTLFFLDKAMHMGGRNIIYAALTASMQMLGGVPEIIIVTWVVAGGLFALELMRQWAQWKTVALRFFSSGLLVVGITAAQMLPFFQLLSHSQRDTGYSNVDVYAMPTWGWANFFVPIFRCSKSFLGVYLQDGQQWTSSYYLGVGIMALAALALLRVRQPRVWLLASIALVGCVLALGKAGVVYAVVQKVFPFLGLMRYPAKWVQLALICVPLLAAFGISSLQREPGGDEVLQNDRGKSLAIVGILAAIAIGIVIACGYRFPSEDASGAAVMNNGVARLVFLALVLGTVFAYTKLDDLVGKTVFGIAALVFIGLDVSTHTPRQQPTVPASDYRPLELKMSQVPQLGLSRVMLSPPLQMTMRRAGSSDPSEDYRVKRMVLFADSNLIEKVPKVNGMFSLYTKEQADIEKELYNPKEFPQALAAFTGISQVCSILGNQGMGWRWEGNDSFLPMLTLGQKPLFGNDTEVKLGITGQRFNPVQVVYLPEEAKGQLTVTDPVVGANILADPNMGIAPPQFSNREISFVAVSPAPAMVVVAQTYYPAWKAYVDGRPTKIWRANHAFQAIEMPEGQHSIRFVYEDDVFKIGAIISGITLLICAVGWFRLRKTPLVAV